MYEIELEDGTTITAQDIGTALEWDINAALEFCAAILEDVNAHPEARMLRRELEKYQP